MPSRGFFVFGHERRRQSNAGEEEAQSMSEPFWKKAREVVIDVVAVAVVIATTVLIEKLLRTEGNRSSGNDTEPERSP
jgi:hypothetical protein